MEAIEIPLFDANCKTYKKCIVIPIRNTLKRSYNVIILESISSYKTPINNKRWKLIKKFKKEKCSYIKASYMGVDSNKNRKKPRIKVDMKDIFEMGITDDEIIKLLKEEEKS